jgi:acyl-CoA thioester hydrolase
VYGRLPRVHVSVDYRRILWFRDLVEVAVSVAAVGRTSVTYAFELLRNGERCAEGRVVAALVDNSGKPEPWPEPYAALLGGDGGRD